MTVFKALIVIVEAGFELRFTTAIIILQRLLIVLLL